MAHAAWVEQAFLRRAFRANRKALRCAVIDTAAMARAAGLAERSRAEPNLGGLAGGCGCVVSPHHALGDAITAAEVFLALATRLSRRIYHTARDLIDPDDRGPRAATIGSDCGHLALECRLSTVVQIDASPRQPPPAPVRPTAQEKPRGYDGVTPEEPACSAGGARHRRPHRCRSAYLEKLGSSRS